MRGHLLLLLLPPAAFAATGDGPRWLRMWALAGALFVGFKWLSWCVVPRGSRRVSPARTAAFFCGWVGLDPSPFLDGRTDPREIGRREWVRAVSLVALGLTLLYEVSPRLAGSEPLAAGWMGWIGMGCVLHFGTLELLALFWRRTGVPVEPIMDAPLRATSLTDFWGRRWNRAFRDVVHRAWFRPLASRVGPSLAGAAVYAASGLLHELVISVPAGAGYGLPTLYFLVQAAGIGIERSASGRRLGLGAGPCGRAFALAVVLLPAPWLFHPGFIRAVVLPMMEAMGAL